jgi:hypothetical protein
VFALQVFRRPEDVSGSIEQLEILIREVKLEYVLSAGISNQIGDDGLSGLTQAPIQLTFNLPRKN